MNIAEDTLPEFIETERLILRRHKEGDLQDLHEYLTEGRIMKYGPYSNLTMEQTRKNLEWRIGTDEMIAVERKEDHKMIGNFYFGRCDYNARELGFIIAGNCRNCGYAAEGCRALIHTAFAKGLHRIFAECDPDNTVSWLLLEELGFEREGCLRQSIYYSVDGEDKPIWKDKYIYSIINREA